MLVMRLLCCGVALALASPLIASANQVDYECSDPFGIAIGTVANNPFTADEVVTSWQVLPDGTSRQMAFISIIHIARDSAGRVRIQVPAEYGPGKSAEAGDEADFWDTTICDPSAVTSTRISEDLHIAVQQDPAIGKQVQSVLRVDGKASVWYGLRHAGPTRFQEGRRFRSIKVDDIGYKELDDLQAHGFRTWPVDGAIVDSKFTEEWLSDELAAVLLRVDTRQTANHESRAELTHLRRVEPDPKLFQIPAGYKVTYRNSKPPVRPCAEKMPTPVATGGCR
jgi:hypothetical protein